MKHICYLLLVSLFFLPLRAQEEEDSQYLIFHVTPAEALVTVNGEIWNNADGIALKFVPLGTYDYRVEAKLYHPVTGQVTVNDPNQKAEVSVTLQPSFGYITVPNEGSLLGATIYIDKEPVGLAPLTSQPLASGTHTVTAVKTNYQSDEQTVELHDGETKTVAPVLRADYAMVTLTVEENAEIWVNGELKGTGTWTGGLTSGDYKIETRLPNRRSMSVMKHISSEEARQTIALETPVEAYGSLNISTVPDMADVYIDEKYVGQTPLFMRRYLVGDYDIRIRKDHFEDYHTTVTVLEHQMTAVEGRMQSVATTPAPQK